LQIISAPQLVDLPQAAYFQRDVLGHLQSMRHGGPTIAFVEIKSTTATLAVLIAPQGTSWGMELSPFPSARQYWNDLSEKRRLEFWGLLATELGSRGISFQDLPSWILGQLYRKHAPLPPGTEQSHGHPPTWVRIFVIETKRGRRDLQAFLERAISEFQSFFLLSDKLAPLPIPESLTSLFFMPEFSESGAEQMRRRWEQLQQSEFSVLSSLSRQSAMSLLSSWFLFCDPTNLPSVIPNYEFSGRLSASLLQFPLRPFMKDRTESNQFMIDKARSAHLRLRLLRAWQWPLGLWYIRAGSGNESDSAWVRMLGNTLETRGFGSNGSYESLLTEHLAEMRLKYPLLFEFSAVQ
jgi:hypothetical protein